MNRDTILLVAASSGLAVLALIVAISAHRRLAVARRSLAVLQATSNGKTLLDVVATYGRDLKIFEDALNTIVDRQEELMAGLALSVRNIAVVRYDHGSGLVLSAISGRTEARAYAKIVDEGESEIGLSPEERKAIAEAMTDRKRQKSKVRARR